MAPLPPDPLRGEIWSAKASAILPILQAAAACSLVGLSEAMLSDKTSLESCKTSDLPHRPCLVIGDDEEDSTVDIVVFTTCGSGRTHISQMSAHSQFFAVSVGVTRPWPASDSPVLNVLPSWPMSKLYPSYAIAYIVTVSRSALTHRWRERAHPGAVFRCDEDLVEELEALCDQRKSAFHSLAPGERANWDRTYAVSRKEWLAGRPSQSTLSTLASEVHAARYAMSEQPYPAAQRAGQSNRPPALSALPPIASHSQHPVQDPFPPLESPTAKRHPDDHPGVPLSQARANGTVSRAHGSRIPGGQLDSHNIGLPAARTNEALDSPQTTPTDSPSSSVDSLSTSDSEHLPSDSPLDDDSGKCSATLATDNRLLISLDGDDSEATAVPGLISYSHVVKSTTSTRADIFSPKSGIAIIGSQRAKKAGRFSKVNILTIGLRVGLRTRTTAF